MKHELATAVAKLSPSAAVAGSSAAGWLDNINTYGQAAVYITSVVYALLMIFVLVRDKIIRNHEQSNAGQAGRTSRDSRTSPE